MHRPDLGWWRNPGTPREPAPDLGADGGNLPGSRRTAPPIYNVQIQENRNPNPDHPDITVTFRGGKGQISSRRSLSPWYRQRGHRFTKEIDQPPNGQISVGDSVTFTTATTGIDRVIVVVTILGKDYKIIDMNDDYNSHP